MIEEVCVKCAKPIKLTEDKSITRCPWCKDFFMPLSEQIVIYDEELHHLKYTRPGKWFIQNPFKTNILRFLILSAIFLYSYYILAFYIVFELWFYQCLHGKIAKEINLLEKKVMELERLYNKEEV